MDFPVGLSWGDFFDFSTLPISPVKIKTITTNSIAKDEGEKMAVMLGMVAFSSSGRELIYLFMPVSSLTVKNVLN